jgi:transposase-like protein
METPLTFKHCPNKNCSSHSEQKQPFRYYSYGSYRTKAFGLVPRYRCHSCHRTFSAQTFSIDYYAKRTVPYQIILDEISTGAGCIDIARILKCNIKTVLNKLGRLSRSAIALQAKALKAMPWQEGFCYDGFESFTYSQYFPNNIGLLVGKESQFLYLLDYTTLRRKGRMTHAQKAKRTDIEKKHRVPKGALKQSVQRTFLDLSQRLIKKRITRSRLFTDEHQVYQKVLTMQPRKRIRLEHSQISSKLSRTFQNPLFPVNYMDRQIRKDNSDHHRETVQFAKNPAGMMSRMSIYRAMHNFQKPFRIKESRKGDERTHGEVAGLPKHVQKALWSQFKVKRPFLSRVSLSETERKLWFEEFTLPNFTSNKYVPNYLKD